MRKSSPYWAEQWGGKTNRYYMDTESFIQKTTGALALNGDKADLSIFSAGRTQTFNFPGQSPVQFKTVFPQTANGKIHLAPAELGKNAYHYQPVRDPNYPLALISPANSKMLSSTMGEFNYPELFLTMHPDDAAARNIQAGDTVRIFNQLGEVICRVRCHSSIRKGVVSMPKGAWRKSSRNQMTATALCPSTVNEVAGGACFNDARVEVEKF
ncbi:hypothetical protein GWN26_02150 [Candidatus Saccharibacteria bacterium]|nr:hypothetical protein [Calditrichia bacterium]NIV71465.1 hypothetical protein [Calditrichia bacterium]NIV98003.1 hypothetical protein [Candidatus Saccharibacteria bacterium]NIW78299.1 hypothetical protein [Calditrichia bacterium]